MESIRYLALGDSYTIGTGLENESLNFPSLLARRLTEETGIDVTLVNLGVNGYTTMDLIREELPVARGVRPELVTILIGANDVVQGSDEATYRARMKQIYQAVRELDLPAERVLAISIPDFSPLPGAAPFGSARQLRARIDAFNDIARSEAASRSFRYADITRISREADPGNDWLAADGLHPGPAQHRAFADRIWETGKAWSAVGLDRWSNAAKRVLALAEEEAETLRHPYIGTEHLLLGVVRDTKGAGGQLLNRRGVTYQKVRYYVDAIVDTRRDWDVPRIIPTSRVKKVIRIAFREAITERADAVGTEHILLALLVEGEGIAWHVLEDMGVTLASARNDLERWHQEGRTTD